MSRAKCCHLIIIFPLSISYRLTLKRGSRYIVNTEYIHIRITVSQSVRILLRPFIYATSSRFPSPSNNCLVLDLQEILSRQVLVTDRNQGTIREEHRIPSYCTSFGRSILVYRKVRAGCQILQSALRRVPGSDHSMPPSGGGVRLI